jgi:FixJ family two-component response regulator
MSPTKAKKRETVFIVDDDPTICEGLCDLLESAGITSQSFISAEEFLTAWNPQMQGCLLLDVRLPGMSGLELQEKLLRANLSIPVIIMTAHGDIPMVRKALKSGAFEFLVKPFHDSELLSSIDQLFADREKLRGKEDLVRSVTARMQTLTAREREVMELVSAGHTNREIAEKLYLSVVTIKMHRGQMMRKMQAESVADLVRMADLAR